VPAVVNGRAGVIDDVMRDRVTTDDADADATNDATVAPNDEDDFGIDCGLVVDVTTLALVGKLQPEEQLQSAGQPPDF
jgi:hypothetical protein